MLSARWTLAIALAAAIGCSSSSPAPLDLATWMQLRSVTALAMAPDGQRVAYVVERGDSAADRYRRELWVVAVAGGEPLRADTGEGEAPAWLPDGRLAFLSRRGGTAQVWAVRPGAGAPAEALTALPQGVLEFRAAPHGRALALRAELPGTGRVGLHVQPMGGAAVARTGPDRTVHDVDWSPDGSALALSYSLAPGVRALILGSEIAVVDADGGPVRPLVERPGMDLGPRWSPDGRRIAFLSHGGRTDWIGTTTLHLVPAAGGVPQPIGSDLGERILPGEFDLEWDSGGAGLLFTVPRAQGGRVVLVPADGGASRRITTDSLVAGSFSASADRSVLAFIGAAPAHHGEIFAQRRDGSALRRLTTTNPELDRRRHGVMWEVAWTSPDGRPARGLLVTPDGRTGPHPLLVYLHGGPAWHFVRGLAPQGHLPKVLQGEPHPVPVLAACGYAVFLPNPRGSVGFGELDRLANVMRLGRGDVDDVLSGVDHLVREGVADSARLGIMGWSYGGALAYQTLVRAPGRFRVAEIGAGLTDPRALHAAMDIPDLMEAYFNGPPSSPASGYAAWEAIFARPRFATPTLLRHGAEDRRVPLAQSESLVVKLRAAGTRESLVVFAGEGHALRRPSSQRAGFRVLMDWLGTELGTCEPGAGR